MFSALFKKEVGPYVLGQLLGTGATSTVHLGEHKDTKKLVPATILSHFAHFAAHRGCQVAIKMVKRTQKSRLHDSVFEREVLLRLIAFLLPPPSLLFSQVNALKQLSHNNLLRLESIFRDDEHDCM
jgi:serine/threonine protein kinase